MYDFEHLLFLVKDPFTRGKNPETIIVSYSSIFSIMRLPVGNVGLLDLVTSLVDKATKAVWDFEFEKFNRAYSERRLLNLKQ